MRAAVVTAFTGPDGVAVQDIPEPEPRPGEVLIDVHAAGVIFPDVLQTRGQYQLRPELPFVLGWEVAGVVRHAAGGHPVGDRVAAMPVIGGFAQTVAVRPDWVFPLPDAVSFEAGAALPVNYLSMHFAYRLRAHLQAGETVLVHGAAGGLGSAACQLAAAYGARVLAVVSSPAKADLARACGAQDVVVPADGFLDDVRALTDGRGVDVVVDPVGGDRFPDSLRALATHGRLIVLGFTGREIPTVAVNRLLLRNIAVLGAGSREYYQDHPGAAAHAWAELTPLMNSGAIAPPVTATYPLAQTAAALRAIDERRALGRLVIRLR
ncbi:MAG: NADPH:quinone oxidoreductase family protein [Austwickia sp.]|nr:NADPH:quinone oxidoreductase family protein [Austwickia sp.]